MILVFNLRIYKLLNDIVFDKKISYFIYINSIYDMRRLYVL